MDITRFTDKDGNELSLDTTITNDMYLITVLVDTKIEEPPKTFDSLTTIIGIGVLSLGALGIAYKKYLVH